jgi:hypothetical protein
MKHLVVFDLDETLGDFVKLSEMVGPHKPTIQLITLILDQHPHIMRPMMFHVLDVVKSLKERGQCTVVLYTNNMGPRLWTSLIKQYIERKMNFKLFDHAILGYHLPGGRTTPQKCLRDLLTITKHPLATQVFFVDDQLHEQMLGEQVYYFHIAPYKYMNGDFETTNLLLSHLVHFFKTR